MLPHRTCAEITPTTAPATSTENILTRALPFVLERHKQRLPATESRELSS